jgi:hypothetical protein
MELAQLHAFERRTVDTVEAELRQALPAASLHRRAALGVVVHGPWRPADLWPGALERLVWTVALESGGRPVLSAAGEAALAGQGIARRHAPIHPVEALALRAGEGLVLVHSDAARLAYVAVYRQRRLAWSLMLHDDERLVRCDGQVVQVAQPPGWFPEGDRTGVLLAGLQQWLRDPFALEEGDRFILPDLLGQLTEVPEPRWLVRDGEWLRSDGRARAFG